MTTCEYLKSFHTTRIPRTVLLQTSKFRNNIEPFTAIKKWLRGRIFNIINLCDLYCNFKGIFSWQPNESYKKIPDVIYIIFEDIWVLQPCYTLLTKPSRILILLHDELYLWKVPMSYIFINMYISPASTSISSDMTHMYSNTLALRSFLVLIYLQIYPWVSYFL